MSAAVVTIRMDVVSNESSPETLDACEGRAFNLLFVFLACLRSLLVVLLAFVADAGLLHFLAHAFQQVAHAVRRLLRGLVEAVVGGVGDDGESEQACNDDRSHGYFPLKSGLRLARKAATPSRKSSVS